MPTPTIGAEQYFIGIHPDREVRNATIWKFSEGVACRVDAEQRNRVLSGEPPDVVVEDLPGWSFAKLPLRPGQFFPRIARPSNKNLLESPGFNPQTRESWPSIQTS